MTQDELTKVIIVAISEATGIEPRELLPLTGAFDKLYTNFKAYLWAVHDIQVTD